MERLKIDSYVKETQSGRLQYNILACLEDILTELKKITDQDTALNVIDHESINKEFKCECGRQFENSKQLRGHKMKCKGSG